jgi:sarcosine oxidase subunit beta
LADVLVVGAGIVGCATAYWLASEGYDVTVCESGRTLAAMGSGWSFGGVRIAGRPEAEIPLMRAGLPLWETLSERLDHECHYRRSGNLRIATREDEASALLQFSERCAMSGIPHLLMSTADMREHTPLLGRPAQGGVFCPLDGQADPLETCAGFASAAARYGAKFKLSTEVGCILEKAGKVVGVHTREGDLAADAVVIAAGICASELLPEWQTLRPIAIESVASLRTVPTDLVLRPVISTLDGTFAIRQDHCGRVHVITMCAACPKVDAESWRVSTTIGSSGEVAMRDAVGPYLPALTALSTRESWLGYVDITLTGLPVIDTSKEIEGLVVAAGFCGRGFGLGPLVGMLAAELAKGHQPALELSAFSAYCCRATHAPQKLHG